MKKPIFTCLLYFLALASCTDTPIKDELYSINYETKAERVNVLKGEITAKSDFENAEFLLYSSNGFTFNPSSLFTPDYKDYKYVVKVSPEDIDKWTTGLTKVTPSVDFEVWPHNLIRIRKEEWQLQSKPEYYTMKEESVYVLVYRKEGILFKKAITF
ncbi:hypothetical protein [Maribacter polysaccharolyticus]|uniref:hypothetical protein n=1 Tax=Maribacter polysaccharolyticus TaxID=3020831 RepID=UPI00237F9F5E|nr:hypothetical protein [Maribacter polysaccharolyticus]MDE3743308.1 hypothetical protein [Maribacter polysaccharolyticus]